jgi:hypothetical protein
LGPLVLVLDFHIWDIKFVDDHPMNVSVKVGFTWPCGFREEDWNVKGYGWRRQTQSDENTSQSFGSGGLKMQDHNLVILSLHPSSRKKAYNCQFHFLK